jgi:hypothetical protein
VNPTPSVLRELTGHWVEAGQAGEREAGAPGCKGKAGAPAAPMHLFIP